MSEVAIRVLRHHIAHDAGTGDADVERVVGLPDPVMGAGHERAVLRDVGEDRQLGAADAFVRAVGQVCDDVTDLDDGVHVDPGQGGGQIQKSADAFGLGECLGNRIDKVFLGCGGAFLNHGSETTQEIDVGFLGGHVEGFGELDRGDRLTRQGLQKQRGRRDRDPSVRDGDAVLLLQSVGAVVEQLAFLDDSCLGLLDQPVQVPIHAILQVDAQCDGTDIEMMIQRHADGFKDFFDRDTHNRKSLGSFKFQGNKEKRSPESVTALTSNLKRNTSNSLTPCASP